VEILFSAKRGFYPTVVLIDDRALHAPAALRVILKFIS
jgi:hypothetical protein